RSRRSHASISGRLRQARPRSLFARAASLAAWAPAGPGTAEDRKDEQPDSTVVSMMVRKRTPTWGVRSKGPATTVKPGCVASEPHPTTGRRAVVARRADERSLHRFARRARRRAAPDDQAHERNAIISEGDHLRRRRRKERRRGWYAPDDERRPIRPCTQPTDDAAVPPAMVSQGHDDVLDQVQRPPVRLRARHAERPLVGRIAH